MNRTINRAILGTVPVIPVSATGWAVLVVVVIPVLAALFATIIDSPGLYIIGGWYAVLGNFCASWASLLMLVVAALLVAAIFIGLPFMMLVTAQVDWACRLVSRIEKWVVPRDDMFETDGYKTGEVVQTMWDDIFKDHISYQSPRTETACSIVQLCALPIASFLILAAIRIFF